LDLDRPAQSASTTYEEPHAMNMIFSNVRTADLRGLNAYRSFGAVGEARPCPEDPTQAHCRPQQSSDADRAYAEAQRLKLGPPPPAGSSPDRVAAYSQRAAAFREANKKICRKSIGIGRSAPICKTQAEWDNKAGKKQKIGIGSQPRRGGGGAAAGAGAGAGAAGGAGSAVAAGGGSVYPDAAPPADAPDAAAGGMSTMTMVLIGVAALAVVGGGAYVLLK